jgi:hypothetical protein
VVRVHKMYCHIDPSLYWAVTSRDDVLLDSGMVRDTKVDTLVDDDETDMKPTVSYSVHPLKYCPWIPTYRGELQLSSGDMRLVRPWQYDVVHLHCDDN